MTTGKLGDRAWVENHGWGEVLSIAGRMVTVRLDTGETVTWSYPGVVPAGAVLEETATTISTGPYRWEGAPRGAWCCDYAKLNKGSEHV